jgi:hypothetical protein
MRFNGIGPMRVKPVALGFHWNKGPCETDQSNHGPHASMICLAQALIPVKPGTAWGFTLNLTPAFGHMR